MAQVSRVFVYTLMIGMLAFGSANTLISKAMDLEDFEHPYFQCATMFAGEFMCLIAFGIMRWNEKRKASPAAQNLVQAKPAAPKEGLVAKAGPLIFFIPAFFDTCGSTMMFIGLVLSAASVYQMVRGFIIVVVAIYSIVFLKRTLYRHQVFGVCFAFLGVVVVGISAVLFESSSAKSPILGMIFLILGQFFAGGVFVSEEKFLGKITVHPMQAVGIEGSAGLIYYFILLPVMYFIPCSNDNLCSHGRVEDSINAFYQIGTNWILMLCWWGTMFSIAFFNFTGISTTKYASALARSTIDTSRTLIVWVFSMAVGWEQFEWLQLIGFALLVIGTTVYNEVLILPWWGFKEAVEKHRAAAAGHGTETHDGKDLDTLGFNPDKKYEYSETSSDMLDYRPPSTKK
ncbi:unnamed protein product [Blepharisma stoltei]|uniref:Solute carrier family 35 member F6 n=1 Tax=Blepharisma stoltei TaxID=1481888 RepID=A0AAU9JAM2_9CILI|nr:unnamed protein product [Blepharisma stoltei]